MLRLGSEVSMSQSLAPTRPVYSGFVTALTNSSSCSRYISLAAASPGQCHSHQLCPWQASILAVVCGRGEAPQRDPGSQTKSKPHDWQLPWPRERERHFPPVDRITSSLTSPASRAAELLSCQLWLGVREHPQSFSSDVFFNWPDTQAFWPDQRVFLFPSLLCCLSLSPLLFSPLLPSLLTFLFLSPFLGTCQYLSRP